MKKPYECTNGQNSCLIYFLPFCRNLLLPLTPNLSDMLSCFLLVIYMVFKIFH